MTPFPGHPDGRSAEGAAWVFPDLDLSEMRKTDGRRPHLPVAPVLSGPWYNK